MLLLKEAIVKGTFYIAGERLSLRTSNAKEALDEAMTLLVESVYGKLNYGNASNLVLKCKMLE